MRTTKILVVDDHGQWRSMLRTQLEANHGALFRQLTAIP
jgi:hypothetical protein